MENVVEYVKSLPCSQIKPQKVGANVLDEGVVQAIQKEAQTINVRSPGVTDRKKYLNNNCMCFFVKKIYEILSCIDM